MEGHRCHDAGALALCNHEETGVDRQRGFTLIEVLVALGVLSLGIASAIALFAAATASHKRAIHQTNAAAIAEQAMAEVELALATGADPLGLESNPPFQGLLYDFPAYNVSVKFWSQMPIKPDDVILAEITVSWIAGSTERNAKFRQWLTREDHIHSVPYEEPEEDYSRP